MLNTNQLATGAWSSKVFWSLVLRGGFVLSLSTASEIVFSFVLAADELSASERFAVSVLSAINRLRGGPWLTRYSPHQLKDHLIAMGFSRVTHFSTEDANERYFGCRRDRMAASNAEEMMRAVVWWLGMKQSTTIVELSASANSCL
jgi:hypothetical protein